MTNKEIRALDRKYSSGELSFDAWYAELMRNGVTVERYKAFMIRETLEWLLWCAIGVVATALGCSLMIYFS